jgi:RecA-family ATPase
MVGMATKGASGGSAEGEAAFDQWSQKHPSYDAKKTAKLWEGLRPKDIGFGKLKHLADEARAKRQSQPTDFVIKPKKEKKNKELPELESMFLEELHAMPVEPLEWIAKDLIVANAVNGLFGDGGTGKDLILLQLAIAMTCGAQWLGHDVEQGRVIYFPTEDPVQELRRRENDIVNYYAAEGMYKPVPKRLKIVPMAGKDTFLAAYDSRSGIVLETPLFMSVQQMTADFKPNLVIVGNRVNIFAVNQNDDAQAQQCVRMLSRLCMTYNTTVIMPGHVSLHSQRTGEGTSGSVQWSNACRMRTYLHRIKDTEDGKEIEPDPNMRELEVMKANWAPTNKIVSLEWRDGLFKPDSVEVERQEQPQETQAERDLKDEEEFLRMLDSLVGGQHVSSILTAPNYAPAYFSKQSNCRLKGHKARLAAAMARLHRKKIIDTITEGPPSKPRSRIVRVKKGS